MLKNRPLKIGLDFHGVITDNPAYFKILADLAISRGDEIHIISGGPQLTIIQFLNKWGIKYTSVFAIVDYYDARGDVRFFENGEFKVDDKLWNRAKAKYCKEHKIDIHIDDTLKYSEGFETPFCIYDGQNRRCRTKDTVIDLSVSPEQSLNEIENFIKQKRSM